MWSDQDFTKSGGFDVSGYDSPTPAATSDVKTKRPSSIFPVSIKQILESSEVMEIAGQVVNMMTIIGIVKSINVTSTKIIYELEDWSGKITAMLWLEDSEQKNNSGIVENTYVAMSGTKRTQGNQVVFFIYNIRPVEDLKEITYHYLKVIQIPLKKEEQANITVSVPGGGGNDGENGLNLPPNHTKIYRVIQNVKSEAGISKNEILQLTKVPMSELNTIIDFLITEGHVYCTIDDDHYRVTDA